MLKARRKGLRSGHTTGACAAAAAKAATMLLLGTGGQNRTKVEIPFPDHSRAAFRIHASGKENGSAWAAVIKDAGDDPDVTNGAEIRADARLVRGSASGPVIKGGAGVGIVTKPGLPVAVGEPAINPMPREMIRQAVMEAIGTTQDGTWSIEITISVPRGEILAKKTLNPRLGIVGGISILGTTGIVRPVSSEAWTATISASMDVAGAMGRDTIVLSAGRASELAHMRKYRFPEEAYVMMGDYLEFAFLEAGKRGFTAIHLCAQWAKMLKIAMATPHTHVKHGAINIKRAVKLLKDLGYPPRTAGHEFNTAREVFDSLVSLPDSRRSALLSKVCAAAERYAGEIVSGVPVTACLVSYEGEIIATSR